MNLLRNGALCAALVFALSGCATKTAYVSKSQDASVDTDADTDVDTDTDADSDGDSDSDSDTGIEIEPIEMDCSDCPAVGGTLENMLCAIDICDGNVVVNNEYSSPIAFVDFGCSSLADTYEAVSRFGDLSNDLAPMLNGSYAMMGNGNVSDNMHDDMCDGNVEEGFTDPYCYETDPYSGEEFTIYDVMEWKLTLTAPEDAHSFRFIYVFFSSEYDEWVGGAYNDKFYAVLKAGSTNGGAETVINFTKCRDPDVYSNFVCEAGDIGCEEGERYCYIAVNTAYSDCCWYDDCPDGVSADVGTDISGTGFECALGQGVDSSAHGSSTGWLETLWPIEPGETFDITFHIHDTSDSVYDSQVILDSFQFLKNSVDEQTGPVV